MIKKILLLVFCCMQVYADLNHWDQLKQAKSNAYGITFKARFFDDRHKQYDYQNGHVYFKQNEDFLLDYTAPIERHIWRNQRYLNVYEPIYNKVTKGVSKLQGEIEFVPILDSLAQLKAQYLLTREKDKFILTPKKNQAKQLINRIEISLDAKNHFQQYMINDNVGFQVVIDFDLDKQQTQQPNIDVKYPKTAEVTHYDRHTKI